MLVLTARAYVSENELIVDFGVTRTQFSLWDNGKHVQNYACYSDASAAAKRLNANRPEFTEE